MSFHPIHFTQHAFTSTLHSDKKYHTSNFNVFLVLMTALFFFTVLGWFNFAIAWYGTITSTDPNHQDQTWSSFGFALFWTFLAIAIYIVMNYYGVLDIDQKISEEPLLRGESRDLGKNISSEGDILGAIDMRSI